MNPVFRGRLRAFCPHLFYYTRGVWTSLCMKRDLYRVVVQLAITSPHHWFVCTVFFSSKSTYFLLIYGRISWITNVGKFSFSASLQISENQRVDPLGSWMDFVKRPVGNFPGKCRKRKRPLVNPVDWLAVFRTITFFIQFEAWQYYALLSSTSRAHPVLQVLLAHRDLLALRELKWPRKFFSRSSKRWLKVGQCSFFHPGYISASLRATKLLFQKTCRQKPDDRLRNFYVHHIFGVSSYYHGGTVWMICTVLTWTCFSVRGYREEISGTGQTNQPQPATDCSAHPGGDDLLPTNRGGFPLQAQGTRGGRQEDSGGAPELSDGMFVWNQVNVYGLVQLRSLCMAEKEQFWLILLCMVTRSILTHLPLCLNYVWKSECLVIIA